MKKAYSDLAQTVRLASVEYGSYDNWDYSLSNAEFFKKYFYPFISLSKNTVGNVKQDNIKYLQASGKVEDGLLVMRDEGEIVELMSGSQIFTYPFVSDGAGSGQMRKCYAVDINGYRKPNKFGRDLFMFCLVAEKDIVAHYFDDGTTDYTAKTREELKNGPSSYRYNCNKNARGMWCAALIMADGWQIKEDYPW